MPRAGQAPPARVRVLPEAAALEDHAGRRLDADEHRAVDQRAVGVAFGARPERRSRGRRRRRPGSTSVWSSVSGAMATVCRVAWDVAVIGAGYVGLPLAVRFAETGTTGGLRRPRRRPRWRSSPRARLRRRRAVGRAGAAGARRAARRDHRLRRRPRRRRDHHLRPDAADAEPRAGHVVHPRPPPTSIARAAAARAGGRARVDHVPRHHRGLLRPILETSGLAAGTDFHLAMSPERIDPGRTDFTIRNTPKVVGGITPACTEARDGRLPGVLRRARAASRRPTRPS